MAEPNTTAAAPPQPPPQQQQFNMAEFGRPMNGTPQQQQQQQHNPNPMLMGQQQPPPPMMQQPPMQHHPQQHPPMHPHQQQPPMQHHQQQPHGGPNPGAHHPHPHAMNAWMQTPQAAAQMFAAYARSMQGGPNGQAPSGAPPPPGGAAPNQTEISAGQTELAAVPGSSSATTTTTTGAGGGATSRPTFVNAKQYRRILKRRQARAVLQEFNKRKRAARDGKQQPFLYASRHRHAMKRPRGPGGRFLTKPELEVYYREHPEVPNPDAIVENVNGGGIEEEPAEKKQKTVQEEGV